MITVCFSDCSQNKVILKVKGHSSEDKGNDIVCAAISALTDTFLRGLETNLKAQLKGSFKPGDCDVMAEVSGNRAKEFKIICEIFKNGFHKISESYPEQVKLICQEIYHGS